MTPKTLLAVLTLGLVIGFQAGTAAGSLADAWSDLIRKYPPPVPTEAERGQLANVYANVLPAYPETLFKRDQVRYEDILKHAPAYYRRQSFSPRQAKICRERLAPYADMIQKAAASFDVPKQIIGAVILQESSGDPRARAKTTSAKGLMQTINATFEMAQNHLAHEGIRIADPFNPRDSILAGTWYLSYVFELAKRDFPAFADRNDPQMWAKALEYYYAGPKWGKHPRPIFQVTVNGKQLTIKKGYYAQNVLAYAEVL